MKMQDVLPKGVVLETLPEEHQENLEELLIKISAMEDSFGRPFACSSGYRTLEHHEEIYRIKNEKRIEAGLKPVPIPMGSRHLEGLAVDVLDPKRVLQHWILDHLEYAEDHGLYFEAFDACQFPTPWVHIQIVPPRSGKRFFEP